MTTTDYLLMVAEHEPAHLAQTPAEMAALLDAQSAFAAGLRVRGVLRDHGRLRPSAEGRRVHRASVQAGPFDEGKALSLYYWLRASTRDEALALGAACPTLPTDSVDIRPIMAGEIPAPMGLQPGKVFGFAVLGRAQSEEAWTQVMDRIDAASRGCFPTDAFLGGVRLHAPSRAMLDGPFLETKEVIGGLFFLRMPSLNEAVHWAKTSPFVMHGTLEIRALWRS